MYKKSENLNLEEMDDRRSKSNGGGGTDAEGPPRLPVEAHLAEGMVENFHLKRPKRFLDVLVSVLGHSLLVAVLLVIPLMYTHALNLPPFERTFLVAPPPPPPPELAHLIERPPKSFFNKGKLFAPKFIPKHIEQVKEEAPQSTPSLGGVPGGVSGGIPGGQLGGALGGILGNSQMVQPLPPKPETRKGPYRVGGRVEAPQLIREVQPIYPPLAKEAKIQGNVVIDSVIDERGNVTQMKVVSGSPFLVTAALDAVEQWKYKPTLLNGTPIAIEMHVTVNFNLGS